MFYGAELMLEIALFWFQLATLNNERGRYEIRGVMGPDEFHDGIRVQAAPASTTMLYERDGCVGDLPGVGGCSTDIQSTSQRAHDTAWHILG